MAKAKPMELGVMSRLNSPDENPFLAITELGITTTQLVNWNMNNLTDENAKRVNDWVAESDIRIAAFWAGYSGRIVWNSSEGPSTCGLVPRDLRQRRVDDLKRGADFAKKIGAPAIVTHCGFIPENPREELYMETVNAIFDVARHCAGLGIGFWFESGQETPLTLLRTIQDLRLTNLGVNLDTANLILYGRGNPVDALDVIGPYVRNLHIKDGVFSTDGSTLGHEVAVGEGKADFDKIVQKLYELNFTGEMIVEREISGPQQNVDILKAIDLIRSLVEKYRGKNDER